MEDQCTISWMLKLMLWHEQDEVINEIQHYDSQLLCRHTCLSWLINLITIIGENHQQLMRHLCTKLFNNKQQLCTRREKLQTNLLLLWMSCSLRTLLSAAAKCRWKTKLLVSFVSDSSNTTSPRSFHHNNNRRCLCPLGVGLQWLELVGGRRRPWLNSSLQTRTDKMNNDLW